MLYPLKHSEFQNNTPGLRNWQFMIVLGHFWAIFGQSPKYFQNGGELAQISRGPNWGTFACKMPNICRGFAQITRGQFLSAFACSIPWNTQNSKTTRLGWDIGNLWHFWPFFWAKSKSLHPPRFCRGPPTLNRMSSVWTITRWWAFGWTQIGF